MLMQYIYFVCMNSFIFFQNSKLKGRKIFYGKHVQKITIFLLKLGIFQHLAYYKLRTTCELFITRLLTEYSLASFAVHQPPEAAASALCAPKQLCLCQDPAM